MNKKRMRKAKEVKEEKKDGMAHEFLMKPTRKKTPRKYLWP